MTTKIPPALLDRTYLETTADTPNAFLGNVAHTSKTFTISSGSITPTRDRVVVAAESGTTDTLNNILTTSLGINTRLHLTADSGDTITIGDAATGAGQIHMADDADYTLSGNKCIEFERIGTDWYEASRSYESIVAATLGTAQATTSGTSFTFSGIPSGTKWIDVMFRGVSLDATDDLLVQIGDAGGIETSGYISAGTRVNDATPDPDDSTAGFIINYGAANETFSGTMHLRLFDASAFAWVCDGSGKLTTAITTYFGGDKALTAELTQLKVLTVGGNNFDAGSINIQYGS